jgi:beta-glucosidase
LKNDQNTLPLSAKTSVALIGPLAADRDNLIGPWSGSGDGQQCTSVLDAFKERAAQSGFILTHAKGCDVLGDDRSGFAEALRIGRQADVIVAVVGENRDLSGEAAARGDIGLPGIQEELVRQLVATGKPVVVVLMNGRPLTIPWMADHAAAIVEAWWLGTQAGPAIADILYGDYNPSGKLVMTFPRHVGQIPIFYNEKSTGRPYDPDSKWNSKYLDMPNAPQYPFGFGLSYTTFAYDAPAVDKRTFTLNDSVHISVKVTNTGSRAGEEIVQLYVRDLVGSVTRPVKELKGFEKIMLQPGQSKDVSFKLTAADLAFHTADMRFTAEPGKFWVMTGPNSRDLHSIEIELVD